MTVRVFAALLMLHFLMPEVVAAPILRKLAPGHVPDVVKHLNLRSQERYPGTNRLNLTIGLPLRNREGLQKLLKDLYDPTSPQYRHYLTPQKFSENFGPTAQDYEAVSEFARSQGFTVTETNAHRMILRVEATASDVEKAFHLRLMLHNHPTQARSFFAPDSEPSVQTDIPILDVSGLDDYGPMEPMMLEESPMSEVALDSWGSGLQGTYRGSDFRQMYAPNSSLYGSGQSVALVEFDGYYLSDIRHYGDEGNLSTDALHNVRLNGFSGVPGKSSIEVSLDIEMVLAMAPALANLYVYEAPNSGDSYNVVLARIASDNLVSQISSSWASHSGPNATTDQIFQQFAAQGMTFFQASGDQGAFSGPIASPCDNPLVTSVGGTTLDGSWWQGWQNESVWSLSPTNAGSGGGISTYYAIPDWQAGLDISANQGSISMRNIPDVAMVADNIYVTCRNGWAGSIRGTSAAAPLWAGYMALINEQAAKQGLPCVGFFNPILYELGRSSHYSNDFHDIVSGNNTNASSPDLFMAVPGYDLCTGWGTPTGPNLIDDLTIRRHRLQVIPAEGVSSHQPAGGPFGTDWSLTLTNAGWMPLNWALGNVPDWLAASVSTGSLGSGESAVVKLALTATATGLAPGKYTAALVFTNLSEGVRISCPITVELVNGTLQVNLAPAEPVGLGANWRLNDGPWLQSGATVSGLMPDLYLVSFSDVPGWATPARYWITIGSNPVSITEVYLAKGDLQVFLAPDQALSDGARWRVDGGSWQTNGAIVQGLISGAHQVSFMNINQPWHQSWEIPPDQIATVLPQSTCVVSAAYRALTGKLKVNAIAGLSTMSWYVSGVGNWNASGEVLELDPGTYIVSFYPASPDCVASNPAPQTVTIRAGELTEISGTYITRNGSVQVSIDSQAAALGALWRVDAGAWHTNGETVELPSCQYYRICFSDVSGLQTPAPQSIYVSAGLQQTVTAVYQGRYAICVTLAPDGAVQAGAQWRVDDGEWRTNGETVAGLAPTNHSVTFMNIAGWISPGTILVADNASHSVSLAVNYVLPFRLDTIAGQFSTTGTNDGSGTNALFNEPAGIVSDATGTAFVADSQNHTIRRIAPLADRWNVTTIAGSPGTPGAADGAGGQATFRYPAGIAVDNCGNLIVADAGNNSIRMLVPVGDSWVASTIAGRSDGSGRVDGIGSSARFNWPCGVAVGTNGNIYVVDYLNCVVRELIHQETNWIVQTIAGDGSSGMNDGIGAAARFRTIASIAADSNNRLYVTDRSCIRQLVRTESGWTVKTIAGDPNNQDFCDGIDSTARFRFPRGITVDGAGNLYLGDDHSIREVQPAGEHWVVLSLLGAGSRTTNVLNPLQISHVPFVAVTTRGSLFVADRGYHTISRASWAGTNCFQVIIQPQAALDAGAEWRCDSGDWQSSCDPIYGLSPGTHTISFRDVNRWRTPDSQTVTFNTNQSLTVQAEYVSLGGTLALNLTPSDAAAAGAQWSVDNGPFQPVTSVVSNLAFGSHYISFSSISNWIAPGSQWVSVESSQTTIVNATYIPLGQVTVTLTPAAAIPDGAQWRIAGRDWRSSGMTISGLLSGNYTIEFSSIPGWFSPDAINLTIRDTNPNQITGEYRAKGRLKVKLSPISSVIAGAKWIVDAGTDYPSEATVEIPAGDHVLQFTSIPGWDTPANMTVSIEQNQLKTVTATYISRPGFIAANLSPQEVLKAGVKWQIDDGPLLDNGATASASPGFHRVHFSSPAGWAAPAPQNIKVTSDQTNRLSVIFKPSENIRPVVSIITPSAGKPWWSKDLTVTGTARDNRGLDFVLCRVNDGPWSKVNGTTNWVATVALSPGTNRIWACAVDLSENRSATNSIVAVYTPTVHLTLKVVGSGSVSPNMNGQYLVVGQHYTFTAKPRSGSVFLNWTGIVSSRQPTIDVIAATNTSLEANFIPSPFESFAGIYSGLFSDAQTNPKNNVGLLTVILAKTGCFSGKVQTGAVVLPFSGTLTAFGAWSGTIGSVTKMSLSLQFQQNSDGSHSLTAHLSDGNSSADLLTHRPGPSNGNPSSLIGKYTMVFGEPDTEAAEQFGFGFAAASIDASGTVHLSGSLADGSKITQSIGLCKYGSWPLYVPLYGGKGSVSGWVSMTNGPTSDIGGTIQWIKPAQSQAKLDPQGLTNSLSLMGSRFGSTNGAPIVTPAQRQLTLDGGNLQATITAGYAIRPNSSVDGGTNRLSLRFTTSSGLFSGSICDPFSGNKIPFNGAILQKQKSGYGFFLGTTRSGAVILK